eukprot:TRINITY_DN2827_c0_g1_i1.p1 TRINITY_DN2827_c0_g1~~TRINITY_DN2827_c0_g1_i1.p1  ORF type:complete len:545 (+),score=113.39 TRINITY_DN2827_c0_g1_i1:45-1637(+)
MLAYALFVAGMAALAGASISLPFDVSEQASFVSVHNALRSSLSDPAPAGLMQTMSWNVALETSAQTWADNCDFVHSTVGENLYATTATTDTPANAMSSWSSELANYIYNPAGQDSTGGYVGHFTQMIWNATTKIGCGRTYCPTLLNAGFTSGTMIVCHYSPPGNFLGQYPYASAVPIVTCPLSPGTAATCTLNSLRINVDSGDLSFASSAALVIQQLSSPTNPIPSQYAGVRFYDVSFSSGSGTVSFLSSLTFTITIPSYSSAKTYDFLIYTGGAWSLAASTCSTGSPTQSGNVMSVPVCHFTEFALVSTVNPTPTKVFGDPHFLGLKGQKYLIVGEPGRVYNLISTPTLLVNALFGRSLGPLKMTVITELGIVVGNDTVFAAQKNRLQLNGALAANVSVLSDGVSTLRRDVEKTGSGITLETPEFFLRWFATFTEVDLSEVKLLRKGDFSLHGLLGQTWRSELWPARAFEEELVNEAQLFSGILDGSGVGDYEVSDGLFGHKFPFSTFKDELFPAVHPVPVGSALHRKA